MTHDRQPSPLTPEAQVRHYGALIGARFDLLGVLPGGRALEIADEAGATFVLKWDEHEASKRRRRVAIDVARRLGSEAGWPVPIFDLVEDETWLYVRQSLMRGAEPTHVTPSLVDQLSGLIDATAGLGSALSAISDWPFRLVDTLVADPIDPTDYCSHEPLRMHSPAGRQLIEQIEQIGAGLSPDHLEPANDVMHWDLHPGNVLVADGEITAVIDLDNAGPGPRGFDLVTFALSSQVLPADPGARSDLFARARGSVSEELWFATNAHLTLRFANWALRTGNDAVAQHWIADGNRRLGVDR